MRMVAPLYEIIIFTASFKEYAELIMNYFEKQIVKENGLFDWILSRNEC